MRTTRKEIDNLAEFVAANLEELGAADTYGPTAGRIQVDYAPAYGGYRLQLAVPGSSAITTSLFGDQRYPAGVFADYLRGISHALAAVRSGRET